MRAFLAPPRRKYEALAAATIGGLVHWQFQETLSATAPADFYGVSNLSTVLGGGGTVVGTNADIYAADGATKGERRSFATGTDGRRGSLGATERTAMLSHDISCEVTCSFISFTNPLQMIAGAAGQTAGASSANNSPFMLCVTNTGALSVVWENGVEQVRQVTTPAGLVTTGVVYHIGVRRWFRGSEVIFDFFIDGRFVSRRTSTQLPAGSSTSAVWLVGAGCKAPLASGGFTIVHEIRFMSDTTGGAGIRSIDFFRNDAARAQQRFDYNKVVKSLNYNAYTRVLVFSPVLSGDTSAVYMGTKRDDALVDLDNLDGSSLSDVSTDYQLRYPVVESAEWSEDIDGEGRSGSFKCAREIYDWRYSPFFETVSPVSFVSAVRVFDLSRPVRIEVAIVPADVERGDVQPWEWTTELDGFMSSVDFGDDTMTIQVRDRTATVQNTFVRPLASNSFKEKVYGNDTTGVALESVLQSIIDDHEPATGYVGGKPSIYTPTSPGWNLRARNLAFEPMLDALNGKVEQIGWVLRHRWDDTRKLFRYTLYEPERTSPVVVRTFAVDEYLEITQARIDEEQIRNVCEIVYTNRLATQAATFTADATSDLITHTSYDVTKWSLVQVSTSGTLPAPLVAATDYYTVRVSATTSKLATSLANAQANVTINLTTAGTGTQTLTVFGTVGGLEDWPRARVVASDSTSIAKYGERFCQITEDAASQIDTATEAQALADSVVADLAEPKAMVSLALPAFPWAQLDDYYTINSRDHFGVATDLAVVKITTAIEGNKHSTVLDLRGKPAGRTDYILGNMITMPGLSVSVPWQPPVDPIAIDLVTSALDGAVNVRWRYPINFRSKAFDGAEVHMTTDLGAWTPSASTRVGFTRADSMFIPITSGPNTDVQTKVIFRDRNKNVSAAVAATTRKPRPGLHDSPVGEVRRIDTDGAWSLASSGTPLYFPTASHNPYGAFTAGTGPGGSLFTAPWAGRYTFHISGRFQRAAGSPARSNAYRLLVSTGPSATGVGGTLQTQSRNSGWVLPDTSTSNGSEIVEWTTSVQLTAGQICAVTINYVLDPAATSRGYFDQVTDTGSQRCAWKAFFNGAGN